MEARSRDESEGGNGDIGLIDPLDDFARGSDGVCMCVSLEIHTSCRPQSSTPGSSMSESRSNQWY